MRIWSRIMVFLLAALAFACGEPRPASPVETFKTYTKAARNKDYTTMKLLLSDATLKMHEEQAKAQGTDVDEIIKRETLLGENQRTAEYRDEKIDGDRATLKFKNGSGAWEILPFVREDGVWKIDKKGYADQMMREIEEQQKQAFGNVGAPNDIGGTPDPFAEVPMTGVTPETGGSPAVGDAINTSQSPTP